MSPDSRRGNHDTLLSEHFRDGRHVGTRIPFFHPEKVVDWLTDIGRQAQLINELRNKCVLSTLTRRLCDCCFPSNPVPLELRHGKTCRVVHFRETRQRPWQHLSSRAERRRRTRCEEDDFEFGNTTQRIHSWVKTLSSLCWLSQPGQPHQENNFPGSLINLGN